MIYEPTTIIIILYTNQGPFGSCFLRHFRTDYAGIKITLLTTKVLECFYVCVAEMALFWSFLQAQILEGMSLWTISTSWYWFGRGTAHWEYVNEWNNYMDRKYIRRMNIRVGDAWLNELENYHTLRFNRFPEMFPGMKEMLGFLARDWAMLTAAYSFFI